MANTILITANWNTGALSQQTISRQYDNNRYAVRFVGYPEASDGNELDYYLLVWMSTAPGQKPGEITPIQLNSDQWYISNYFTQQVQVIKFQLCVLNEAGTYEAHSPIFSGRIGDSLEHDGTSQDIDVSTLFDAYREYVEELIIGAGAVIIDPTLTQSGQAADAGAVGEAIDAVSVVADEADEIVKNILIEDTGEGGQATLTNEENVVDFYYGATAGYRHGLTPTSLSNGTALYTSTSANEKSPYVAYPCELGSGKWLVGFKIRFTKVDSELGDPSKFMVMLGSNTRTNITVEWGEWIEYSNVAEIDLTRIRFSAVEFSTAPTADQFTVEIKDLYVYEVTGISNDMLTRIQNEQNEDYQDGTVNYGEATITSYIPDDSLTISGKAADSKAVGDAISAVQDAIPAIDATLSVSGDSADAKAVGDMFTKILESQTVSLTNRISTSGFEGANSSFSRSSYTDGVATFLSTNIGEKNPAIKNSCALGSGKWLVGFKCKITKVDSTLGDPKAFRVILGASNRYSYPITYDEWIDIALVDTVDLTRVYIYLYNYSTAPTSGQLKLEIKDCYVYEVSALSQKLLDHVRKTQSATFTDGTCTYSLVTLAESLSNSIQCINVLNYGVTGDGNTDDTDAINALFSAYSGNFYFPAGTYKISGTIYIPSNSCIYGDGDDTIIEMYSCDNLADRTFRGGTHVFPYILVERPFVTIRNIKIVGNNTLQTKTHHGIGVIDTHHCTIKNVTVYNINYDINRDDSASAVVSAYGIALLRSADCLVENCYVEQCGYECIGAVDSAKRCVIRNCYTKNGWRTCIQVHRNASDITVDNCIMIQDNPTYDACFTTHGVSGSEINNLRVTNNVMIMSVNGIQSVYYCAPIQIMGYTQYAFINNNRVSGGKRALYIGPSCPNAKVYANDMECNSDSDYGVKVEATDSIIIGNKLVNDAETPVNRLAEGVTLVGNVGIE